MRHYHRFGIMPRVIGALYECTHITELITLINAARQELEKLRARK